MNSLFERIDKLDTNLRITSEWAKRKYNEFNSRFFGGKLPKDIQFEMSGTQNAVGDASCVVSNMPSAGSIQVGDNYVGKLKIRLSSYFNDITETEAEEVLLHEMIHYSILSRQLKDESAHGPLFRRMMDDINRRFGRHITVSHRRTAEDNARDTAVRQHLVCRVRFRDGRSGLTVAAHTRLLPLWDALAGWSEVGEFRWYITRDPFFNRFPRSKVVKVYRVDDAELEEHLRSAVPLMREGNVVRALR